MNKIFSLDNMLLHQFVFCFMVEFSSGWLLSRHQFPSSFVSPRNFQSMSKRKIGIKTAMLTRELEGTALISGLLEERSDQFAFDLIHGYGAFSKIIAYSADSTLAKKKMLGRSTRYSGLGDALEFLEGSESDLLASNGHLTGVNTWLAFGMDTASVMENAQAAKTAGVRNVVFVVSGNDDIKAAESILKDAKITYTVIRTGNLIEGAEGGSILLANITYDQQPGDVVRNDMIRVACEALRIPSGSNALMELRPGGIPGLRYLKYFRRQGSNKTSEVTTGLSRSDEIEVIMNGGETVFDDFEEEYQRYLANQRAKDDPKPKVIAEEKELVQ